MTDRILVAGDVHLGAERANVDAFSRFLDTVYETRQNVGELVLLGDLWDMVRRDPFGCAWETSEILSQLKRLGRALPVRLILGNHDSYLRSLDTSLYDVDIRDEYVLETNTNTIRFCHGNSFDRLQSDRISSLISGPGDRGDIDPTRGLKDPVVAKIRAGIQRAKRQFSDLVAPLGGQQLTAIEPFPRRERRAHEYLAAIPEDKLVYGHTHAPYVHPANIAANPGSWKSTAPVHNTYIAIVDGEIRLYQYDRSGDDERLA